MNDLDMRDVLHVQKVPGFEVSVCNVPSGETSEIVKSLRTDNHKVRVLTQEVRESVARKIVKEVTAYCPYIGPPSDWKHVDAIVRGVLAGESDERKAVV
jgi:pyruvate/oxaloacetate carboxyltransferase